MSFLSSSSSEEELMRIARELGKWIRIQTNRGKEERPMFSVEQGKQLASPVRN